MKNKITLEWLNAAITRAIKTVAQTALGMFTIGSALNENNWTYIISVSVVAGIYSILTSIVTELPEVGTDGVLQIDASNPNEFYCKMGLDVMGPALLEKKTVKLAVVKEIFTEPPTDTTQ